MRFGWKGVGGGGGVCVLWWINLGVVVSPLNTRDRNVRLASRVTLNLCPFFPPDLFSLSLQSTAVCVCSCVRVHRLKFR